MYLVTLANAAASWADRGLSAPGQLPEPIRSPADPGAPNINPSNTLEAIAALLLGFTPTHAVTLAAQFQPPDPPKLDAIFGVGSEPPDPQLNVLA